jgi:hypothetical protein
MTNTTEERIPAGVEEIAARIMRVGRCGSCGAVADGITPLDCPREHDMGLYVSRPCYYRSQDDDERTGMIVEALRSARLAADAAGYRRGLEEAAKEAERDRTPAYGPHDNLIEWVAETQRIDLAARIRALPRASSASQGER